MVASPLPFRTVNAPRTMLPPFREPADRDSANRDPMAAGGLRLVSAPAGVRVELCQPADMERHAEAWRTLADEALEPNAFMEPGFALPAARHIGAGRPPRFLLAWRHEAGDRARLVGVLALGGRPAPGVAAATAWHHPQWVTSAPMLHRDHAGEALDAMLGWVAGQRAMRGGLVLRGVPEDGALMALIGADPARRRMAVLGSQLRAVLYRPDAGGGAGDGAPGLSAKQRKEMRRQRRRLDEAGDVRLRSAEAPDEVRLATERFLALEARGWKGRRGTALLCNSQLATFARAMTRLMSREGLCRIDTLEIGGEAAAAAVVLRSGDRAYFWKTAYDEGHARRSPGKLLAAALGERQAAEAGVAMTDSCAQPDHPMIDRLWAGRLAHLDLVVAGSGSPAENTDRAVRRLRAVMAARASAKALVGRLRGLLRRG